MSGWGSLMVVSLVAYVVTVCYAFAMFDRLVRIEYAQHRDQWDADGRPFGFFFRPSEVTLVRSTFAFYRVNFLWSWRPPAWSKDSLEATRAFRRLRASNLLGLVLLALTMAFLLLSVG